MKLLFRREFGVSDIVAVLAFLLSVSALFKAFTDESPDINVFFSEEGVFDYYDTVRESRRIVIFFTAQVVNNGKVPMSLLEVRINGPVKSKRDTFENSEELREFIEENEKQSVAVEVRKIPNDLSFLDLIFSRDKSKQGKKLEELCNSGKKCTLIADDSKLQKVEFDFWPKVDIHQKVEPGDSKQMSFAVTMDAFLDNKPLSEYLLLGIVFKLSHETLFFEKIVDVKNSGNDLWQKAN